MGQSQSQLAHEKRPGVFGRGGPGTEQTGAVQGSLRAGPGHKDMYLLEHLFHSKSPRSIPGCVICRPSCVSCLLRGHVLTSLAAGDSAAEGWRRGALGLVYVEELNQS